MTQKFVHTPPLLTKQWQYDYDDNDYDDDDDDDDNDDDDDDMIIEYWYDGYNGICTV